MDSKLLKQDYEKRCEKLHHDIIEYQFLKIKQIFANTK